MDALSCARAKGVNCIHMTGKIGPHEGEEFKLYARGTKHVIYFNWDSWPDEYEAIALKLGAKTLKFRQDDAPEDCYIYYRSGYEAVAEELREIICSRYTIYDKIFSKNEYRIGEILGYSREDVTLYIATSTTKQQHS